MVYKPFKAWVAFSLLISFLSACSNANLPKQNNSSANSEWLLTNALYFKGSKIDWQQRRVSGCSSCLITHDSILQPEGVTRFNTLFKNNQWLAVQEQSSLNVVRLKLPSHTHYLYVEQLESGDLKLFNQQSTFKAALGKATTVTFKKQAFSLLITDFELLSSNESPLPKRAKLFYTAFKLI